jgi:hypothetical protein
MTYPPGRDRRLPRDPFGPAASDTPSPPPKRHLTTWGWLYIANSGVAVVVLLIIGVAVAVNGDTTSRSNHPAGRPTSAATSAPVDTGSSAHTVGDVATLNGNGTRATIKVLDPINRLGRTGNTYLVVTVDIAVQSGSLVYSPLLFDLKDPSGALHGAAFDNAFDDELGTGDVHAGHKVHGTIPFKVSSDFLHGSEVELFGDTFGTLGSWKLP